ncbi:MAG: 50S ribosomal protein L17 [Patescibacteria group bacterium]
MRHRVSGRTLNRNTKQRASLLKNLARELVTHGSIVTTEPKAKELKRLVDKLITTAKKDSIAARRVLHRFFGKRDVVNTLVEQIVPAVSTRTSGFTRIVRQGIRVGDNAQLAQIAWVDMPKITGSVRNPAPKAHAATKKAAPAKKSTVAKKTATTKSAAKKPVKKTASTKKAITTKKASK